MLNIFLNSVLDGLPIATVALLSLIGRQTRSGKGAGWTSEPVWAGVSKRIISPLTENLKPVIKPSAVHFTELRNSKRTLINSLLVYGVNLSYFVVRKYKFGTKLGLYSTDCFNSSP
jgi:hypothetical protein